MENNMENDAAWLKPLLTPENMCNPAIVTMLNAYIDSMKVVGIGVALLEEEEKLKMKKPRKRRSCWVWPYLQRRVEQGVYDNLMKELAEETPHLFRQYQRVDKAMFTEIVEALKPIIIKKHTYWREPIPPEIRVALTLRYLATGNSYRTLGFHFRVAPNTVSCIVPEVCRAIIEVYGDKELRMPSSKEEWYQVAQRFEDRWNAPH